MLLPVSDKELWINPSEIVSLTQQDTKVEIRFKNKDVVVLDDSFVDDVARYLNSRPS